MQFIYIFSLKWCLEHVLDLLGWRMEALESRETNLDLSRVVKPLTSHQLSLLSWVVNHSRVVNLAISSKSHNFSALSSFCILDIILSTNIQIDWFKLLWKDNSEYYNFMKKLSWDKVVWMDENTLEPTVYAWMVTLGIVWCLSEFMSIT